MLRRAPWRPRGALLRRPPINPALFPALAHRLPALLAIAAALAGSVPPLAAQAQAAPAGPGWNDQRALALVEVARARRQQPLADSALAAYRADAEGFIYFLLDQEGAEPILLRSDQVALEFYWAQPGRARQVILGMRSQERLPIRDFRYYLDRFTVIQNGFGDEIVVGSGRDVRSVVHPLAPGAEAAYDYRVADSLALRLPGWVERLQVLEVQVRPRDPARPGFVGSLFLEQSRGDLVRMAFTFTPVSYIDPRNERVEIVLENGFWEGRYWLPYQQRLLVRRELPELDLDVGTVIRAVLTVRDYQFNPDLPPDFFSGPAVVARPPAGDLAAYQFAADPLSGLEEAGVTGLAPPGRLLDIDPGRLARVAAARYASSLPPLRLFLPNASSVLRFNRSEGLVAGLGLSYRTAAGSAALLAGYGWGDERPRLDLTLRPRTARGWLSLGLNRPVEPPPGPAEAGLLSSAAAALYASDFLDPVLASGLRAGLATTGAGGTLSLRLQLERQRPPRLIRAAAPLQDERSFRPVLAGEAGTLAAAGLGYQRQLRLLAPLAARAGLELEAGAWRHEAFGRAAARLDLSWQGPAGRAGASLAALAGAVAGRLAPHHLYYLGGRGTLPGYSFRSFVGDRFLLVGAEAWHTVVPPLLSVRALAGAGWTGLSSGRERPDVLPDTGPWHPAPARGARPYLGLGLGLFDRLLRVDFAFPAGSGPGAGAWLLTIDPRLHPLL